MHCYGTYQVPSTYCVPGHQLGVRRLLREAQHEAEGMLCAARAAGALAHRRGIRRARGGKPEAKTPRYICEHMPENYLTRVRLDALKNVFSPTPRLLLPSLCNHLISCSNFTFFTQVRNAFSTSTYNSYIAALSRCCYCYIRAIREPASTVVHVYAGFACYHCN